MVYLLEMVIFHGYVKLPEGNINKHNSEFQYIMVNI